MGPGGHVWHRGILLALGVLLVAVPEAIPGLTIPAEMPMQEMGSMTP